MMRSSKLLSLQPTRVLAMRTAPALRMQAVPSLLLRDTPSLFMRRAPKTRFHTSTKRFFPVPKEEHSAHTISQRIRSAKKIPVELLPLAFILTVAIIAAVWSLVRKFWTDRTLRLTRSGRQH